MITSAVVLAVTACSHGAVAVPSHAATGPAIVNGSPGKHVRRVSGVSLPAAAAQVAAPVSATWQITLSGKLPGPAVVEIPLVRAEPDDGLTVVFTSESPSGPWLPLKTMIVRGGSADWCSASASHTAYQRYCPNA